MAMTNEERFIASCETAGEANVRQKLGAGRFTERKAAWASGWLDQVENGKSEATKDAERTSRNKSADAHPRVRLALFAVGAALLLAGAIVLWAG
jgi:hypothetical protein